jgi:hypothetical protein
MMLLLDLHDDDGDRVLVNITGIIGLEVLLDELGKPSGTYITSVGGHFYEVTESMDEVVEALQKASLVAQGVDPREVYPEEA